MAWHARLALVIFLLTGAHAQAERFPYQAQVVAEAAAVRSGPGSRFYVTGQLMPGETVEVYRHLDDQWCAIRPPSTSFSYVRVEAVRATEQESVVEVIAEDAKTRIGSEVSDARNVEYVRLRRGERLQVLGDPVTLGRSPQLWYRIAPPSGEFRFMHREDIAALGSDPSPQDASAEAASEAASEAGGNSNSRNDRETEKEPVGGDDSGRPGADSESRPAPAEIEAVPRDTEAAWPLAAAPAASPGNAAKLGDASKTATATSDGQVQTAGSEDADASTVVPAAAQTPDKSTGNSINSAASPSNSPGAIPLQKLARRGGQMTTEPIPHSVEAMPVRSIAADNSENGMAERATSRMPESLPSSMSAQPTLGSNTPAASGLDATLPPGASRSGAGSAWNSLEADQPAPPSLQVVDQALGQVAALELELSRIVTQDIGNWRLEELQSRITEVYNLTREPEVQRSLAHLARRTQEFLDLQRRHQSLLAGGPAAIPVMVPAPSLDPPSSGAQAGGPRDPLASLSEPLASLTDSLRRATGDRSSGNMLAGTGGSPSGSSSAGSRGAAKTPQSFSGRGWLVPVLTARPDLPRFALTDAQGRILHFVSPSPGVNLRRYMRQEVGIVGERQPGRSGEASRLVADRVVVLNRQQR